MVRQNVDLGTTSIEGFKELCNVLEPIFTLSEIRVRVVEHVVKSSYSVTEVANIMKVSPTAVSRYIHGSLAPSYKSLCNLLDYLYSVDEELFISLIVDSIKTLWQVFLSSLNNMLKVFGERYSEFFMGVIEELADDIAVVMAKYASRGH